MKKLLIVDGKTLSYKAFLASKNTKTITTTGHNVPMLNTFMSNIIELMGKYEPTAIAIALGIATTPDYAVETDPTYRLQYALLQVLMEELEFRCVHSGEYATEAIKSLVDQAEENEYKSYVVTSEENALQLLSKKTHVVLLGKQRDVHYNPNKFYLEYGIEASHYPDIHALIGKDTKEIPGIPGIGEKKAMKIIHEYGSLDMILEDMNSVSDFRLRELLDLYREELEMGLSQVTLKGLNTSELEVLELDFDKMTFAGFGITSQMVLKHFGLSGLLETQDDDKTSLPLFEFME